MVHDMPRRQCFVPPYRKGRKHALSFGSVTSSLDGAGLGISKHDYCKPEELRVEFSSRLRISPIVYLRYSTHLEDQFRGRERELYRKERPGKSRSAQKTIDLMACYGECCAVCTFPDQEGLVAIASQSSMNQSLPN